jgi:hypothetical protein
MTTVEKEAQADYAFSNARVALAQHLLVWLDEIK